MQQSTLPVRGATRLPSAWLTFRLVIDLKFCSIASKEPDAVPTGGWGEASADELVAGR